MDVPYYVMVPLHLLYVWYDIQSFGYAFLYMLWIRLICLQRQRRRLSFCTIFVFDMLWNASFTDDMLRNVPYAVDMLRNISYAIDMLQLLCAPFAMNWYVLKCPICHWYVPITLCSIRYGSNMLWMTWYVWFGIYWDGILENSCILPYIMIPYSFETVPFVLNMLCHLLSRFWLTPLLYKSFRSACHSSRCLIWAEAVDSYSE